jgi:hypothetical protein
MGHGKYPEMVTYRHGSSRGSCCSDVGASVGCTSHGGLDGNREILQWSGVPMHPRASQRSPAARRSNWLPASSHRRTCVRSCLLTSNIECYGACDALSWVVTCLRIAPFFSGQS